MLKNSTIIVKLNKQNVQSVDWIIFVGLTILIKLSSTFDTNLKLEKHINWICKQYLSSYIYTLRRLSDCYDTISLTMGLLILISNIL